MRGMFAFCVKKREDLRIALDYLEDRITANEAVEQFNEQVKIGRRRGVPRITSVPYTKSEGHRVYELSVARRASDAHFIRLGPELERKIKDDHEFAGLSIKKLGKK